jgi:hypothetical protein
LLIGDQGWGAVEGVLGGDDSSFVFQSDRGAFAATAAVGGVDFQVLEKDLLRLFPEDGLKSHEGGGSGVARHADPGDDHSAIRRLTDHPDPHTAGGGGIQIIPIGTDDGIGCVGIGHVQVGGCCQA